MHNRRGRWLFLVVLLAGVFGFIALWSLVPADTEEAEPDFGGDYVEGIAGMPSRVNPFYANENSVDATLASLIFAGLTRLDENGVPFPDLAQTWTVSPDGMLYTFTLRQGLVWQDGAPLTAADVTFTYELLQSPGLKNPPSVQEVLEDAVFAAPNELTVTIELPEPFAPLPAYLTLGVLPVHLLRDTEPALLYDAGFNQAPVGAGAYRLQVLSLDHAELVANPAYHFEQPFIQTLELRFYRDDGALYDALTAGQVQGALFAAGLGPSDYFQLERRRDLRISPLDTGAISYVYLNLDLPLFEDRRVRQALLYAIDRPKLIEEVLRGQAVPADSPVPPASWAYSGSLSRYQVNTEVANLLLDEAGWRAGPDGIRRKALQVLEFSITASSDPVQSEVARRVAAAWNELGARVTVDARGLTPLVRDLIEQRDYEAVLFVDASESDPDPYAAWHSEGRGGRGDNLALWSNTRVDAILEEARGLASPTRREELYREFQEIFAQEIPAVPLYVPTVLYVQEASLSGVRIGRLAEPGDRFWQVQEWFLKTR
ncbi:MAG TPA: peptide ABC transporter substrate-binding protein [Dehalococcoidia bacterium]|jgi:peptide/nickel transport system substrate-binding protein|nr:peptide ABC transporter substrate-binding protein [Dehalococcoidia bacterium]